MMSDNMIKVGMADLNVAQTGGLKTTGLGSCIGVSLYDAKMKIAGLAHVMLPSSELARDTDFNPAKFVDTAIPELIRRMEVLGAQLRRLEAKLAGGAQMFAFSEGDVLRIGPRNVETCKNLLKQFNIPIIGEDTGGHYGRSIEVHCDTGIVYIRSVHQGVKEL
jgi:chemotaxis protein CheD